MGAQQLKRTTDDGDFQEWFARVARQIDGEPEPSLIPVSVSAALPPDHFFIEVREGRGLSGGGLRSIYGHISQCWHEDNYVRLLHPSLATIPRKLGRRVIFIKSFEGNVETQEVVTWARENGYRLAFPEECDAFFRAHKNAAWNYRTIADLGTLAVQSVSKDREAVVPVWGFDGESAGLSSAPLTRTWGNWYFFLLVRCDP